MPEYRLDTSLDQRRWTRLNAFTRGYVEAAMWTLTNDNGESLDDLGLHDIAEDTLAQAEADCRAFQTANQADLDATGADDAQHGHDFWLTRNRHGAGFWDRGYGHSGRRLTNAAHAAGNVDWCVGDDGRVYQL